MSDRTRTTWARAARAAVWTGVTLAALASVANAGWPPPKDASPREVVAALVGEARRIATSDPDPARRAWAWRSLAHNHEAPSAEMIQAGIEDAHPAVRCEALNAILDLIDSESPAADAARAAVATALTDPDPRVRLAAVMAAETFQPDETWSGPAIAMGLSDPRAAVWRPSLERLEWTEEATSGPAVLDALAFAIRRGGPEQQYAAIGVARLVDAPDETVAAALAPALESRSPEVRWAAALTRAERGVDSLPFCLADRVRPDFRRLTDDGYDVAALAGDDLSALLAKLLERDDATLFLACVDALEYEDHVAELDAGALRRWALSDDPDRVDAAAARRVWSSDEATDRDGQAAALKRAVARFDAASPGDPERRLAAADAVEWLGRVFERPRTIDFAAERDALEYEDRRFTADAAAAVGRSAVESLAAALDDRDPWVRRSAVRALTMALTASELKTGPPIDNADELWKGIFARASDEHFAVRRVVAAGLAWCGRVPLDQPADVSEAAEAAAAKLVADPDRETARAAASHFVGRRDAPGAPAALRTLVALTPATFSLTLDGTPTEYETALEALLTVDPTSRSIDELVSLAAASSDFPDGWSRTDLGSAAIVALLRRPEPEALERFFRELERDPDRWEADVFGSALYWAEDHVPPGAANVAFDARDVAATLDFLERADRVPTLHGRLGATLIGELEDWGDERARERIAAWRRGAAGRPGVRYAALERTYDLDESLRPALESDDPLACLLALPPALDAASFGPLPDWFRNGSPRLAAFARESLRRAVENGDLSQPGL